MSFNDLFALNCSINDCFAPICFPPFAWSGKGMVFDKSDCENELINKYNTSSTFNKPTNATKLAKDPQATITCGMSMRNIAATIIKVIKGNILYTLGNIADGSNTCLKKNFNVA